MALTQAIFSQVLTKRLPSEMEYVLPAESVTAERSTTKFEPSGGYSTYKPNSTMTISLPPIDYFMDPGATSLCFDVSVPSGAGAKLKFPQCGAHGLIRSLKVYHSSGILIDTIDRYDLLSAVQADLSIEQSLRDGILLAMQGMGQAPLSTAPRRVMIPLKNIIFANARHIPLKYLSSVRCEVLWAPASEVLVQTDNATDVPLDYTITNACIYTTLIKPSDTQIAQYDESFRQKGLALYGSTYKHHVLQWTSPNATLTIADRSASMKDVMVVMRDNAVVDPSLATSRSVDKLHARACRVARYQWSLAGRLFPSRPVEGPVETLQELSDATHGQLSGWAVKATEFAKPQVGSYCIAREMESSRTLVSGDKTARDRQVDLNLTLYQLDQLDFGAGPVSAGTPNCSVDVWVHADKVVRFNAEGSVSIFE